MVSLSSANQSLGQIAQQARPQRQSSADAQMRQLVQQARQEAGPGSIVTPQVRFSVGPDGQLVVSGGRVTATPAGQRGELADNQRATPQPTLAQRRANAGAADITPPQLALESQSFAELFSETAQRLQQQEQAIAEDVNESLLESRLRLDDGAIRLEERLHFRAAGGLASGLIQLGTESGPDGQQFARSGQVAIQSPATSDPREAARNAATLARAALAPGTPSAQDFSVARGASQQAASLYGDALARNELADQESRMSLTA